jgi:hypothetical protein
LARGDLRARDRSAAALPSDAGPNVEITIDPLLANRIESERSGREVMVLTTDRGTERWPLVALDGRELAYDRTFKIAVGVRASQSARDIEVLAATELPGGRLAALRVVRELAGAHLMSLGELPIHGAAVADGAGVTLFPGTKHAGKSSLLLYALLAGGTRYVANDRTFVRLDCETPLVRGVPTIVTLREGTLALAPSLQRAILSGAWHYSATVAEGRAHQAAGTVPEGAGFRRPPGISPAQLAFLLGVECTPGGALARIVFPRIGDGRTAVSRLSDEEAAALLIDVGLFAGGEYASFLTGMPAVDRDALVAGARASPRVSRASRAPRRRLVSALDLRLGRDPLVLTLDACARIAGHLARGEIERVKQLLAGEEPRRWPRCSPPPDQQDARADGGPRAGAGHRPAASAPARPAEALLAAYDEAVAALASRGIPVLLLKGFYFADRLHGAATQGREQLDLDLLVRRADRQRALGVLSGLGYGAGGGTSTRGR